MGTLILGYLLIFLAKCADVSLATIRTIFVVKGMKKMAFFIGIFEIIIYLTAMNYVLSDMGNPLKIMSYALGFATGNVVGITLESKLAIGLITAQVFTSKQVEEFADFLRDHGFGVTVIEGRGREGIKYIMQIVLDRKKLIRFEKTALDYDPNAFITVSETRTVRGGYFGRDIGREAMK
ncbi:DUF2179 domain-containing protein [Romboutsia weinsteinii]|uniref:UPF0316 protein CHL78_012785 n=1 Tax=Romboutsia weinsteinii TaxID=2020949 RepID=A0A371J1S5_9FIRM|nr:DUF5698 domain-containing protein [Romboutsia weinsteinii]RDY26616.1 DUF2179 domain-containing protein [Romboutsia weinsteinii]